MENQWLKERIEEALRSEDWDRHMTYSPLREGVLNWYEFSPESDLLELRAESGALTGLFCERCRSVTAVTEKEKEGILRKRLESYDNLSIITASPEWLTAHAGGSFDYVVAAGCLERAAEPAEALRSWINRLKQGGKLLLIVENRFGLKYFCGAGDPFTGLPYDGINGYPGGSGQGRCLSREELERFFEQAGIRNYKFYYPVPDSRMPQMIFTDAYSNGVNAAERLVDYNYEDLRMTGLEHRIFSRMIDAGSLPFLSNSFVIEITMQGSLSDICYAVTTADRGRIYGAATTLRTNRKVRKRPLYPEGEAHLRQLHEQTEALAARGVPVVRTELNRDGSGLYLEMPWIEAEGLSTAVNRIAERDPERFKRVFDDIFHWIRQASEPAGHYDDEGKPLLKKAYLDLAPCNAFFMDDGTLLFYDQEFVKENCPAEFAMFRTLKYCYASDLSLERRIPLASMYTRYGISPENQRGYEAMEDRFVRTVRDLDTYRQMFRWASPDYRRIRARQQKLGTASGQRKPYRTGYVPGVFDLFHAGHLNLLERCKERCDYLIVGVLTEELVQYYKGHGCVFSFEDRVRILSALEIVDEVIPVDFSNTDKLDAWEQLRYDCHFSGDDHLGHWDDILQELRRRGSNMEFFPYTPGISSTKIREELGRD